MDTHPHKSITLPRALAYGAIMLFALCVLNIILELAVFTLYGNSF